MSEIRWGALLMALICIATSTIEHIPQWATYLALFAAGSWFQSFAASVDQRVKHSA